MKVKIDGKEVAASRVDIIYDDVDVPAMDVTATAMLSFTDESIVGDLWIDIVKGEPTNDASFAIEPWSDLARTIRNLDPGLDE